MATVLVVDDIPSNLRLMAAILTHARHEVIQAADAMVALALAEEHHPDLVISDVLMPNIDGFEFVRRLRADASLRDIPVIFHTAHYLDEDARRLATACHVEHVLPKPCDRTLLLDVVERVLGTAPEVRASEVAGVFQRDHQQLVSAKLLEKVAELEREITERREAEDRVRQLNRFYAVLSGINSLIVRATTSDELCHGACRIIVEQGGFRVAALKLVEEDTDALRIVAIAGADAERVAGAVDDWGMDTAMATRQPVARTSMPGAPLLQAFRKVDGEAALLATMALPLVIGEKAVGCLLIGSDTMNGFNEDEMRLLLELAGDISFALDHIEKSDQLNYLAYYDALTGLANRTLFLDRLGHNIDDARIRNNELGVVLADLERFESVNVSLGRHTGDQLLREVAQRLLRTVGDSRLVGRIGADVLGMMIPGVRAGAVRGMLEEWYRQWLGTHFETDQKNVRLSVKTGIAMFPDDASEPEALLRHAEEALRQAKATGVTFAHYARQLSESRAAALAMEEGLKHALENDEFFLVYQPKVDLDSRKVTGLEALVRWRSEELGVVNPASFIPLLEESGMIAEVGIWVMEKANKDHARWREKLDFVPRVAVNVSTVQLRRDNFVDTVSAILGANGREHGIDIEVTESLLLEEAQSNISKLVALRELGIGIAIDDFGAGYSSLGYLTRLPVQTLKIDRSFISAMLDDPSSMTLVSTMISLAHSLRLTVVAEGVESEEQAKILRLLRCDQMQGYLISKPVSFEEMTAFLSRSG